MKSRIRHKQKKNQIEEAHEVKQILKKKGKQQANGTYSWWATNKPLNMEINRGPNFDSNFYYPQIGSYGKCVRVDVTKENHGKKAY